MKFKNSLIGDIISVLFWGAVFLVFLYLVGGMLTGCATAGQKLDRYREVGSMAANPDCLIVNYQYIDREGSLREFRCSGELCGDDCKGKGEAK